MLKRIWFYGLPVYVLNASLLITIATLYKPLSDKTEGIVLLSSSQKDQKDALKKRDCLTNAHSSAKGFLTQKSVLIRTHLLISFALHSCQARVDELPVVALPAGRQVS